MGKKTKKCSRCKSNKDVNYFNKSSQSPDGRQYWCRDCVSANTIRYYKERNLDPVFRKQQSKKSAQVKKNNPDHYKNLELIRSYGITLETYQSMLIDQQNQCGICHKDMKKPNVDHCHATSKVRKLLCKKCNTLLGQAEDNVNILLNAVSYLKEFQNEVN